MAVRSATRHVHSRRIRTAAVHFMLQRRPLYPANELLPVSLSYHTRKARRATCASTEDHQHRRFGQPTVELCRVVDGDRVLRQLGAGQLIKQPVNLASSLMLRDCSCLPSSACSVLHCDPRYAGSRTSSFFLLALPRPPAACRFPPIWPAVFCAGGSASGTGSPQLRGILTRSAVS